MKRKQLLLMGLVLVLILALIYAFWTNPRQERVASERGSGTSERGASNRATSDERKVRLDLLEEKVGAFKGIQRDLFGPLFPPPKVVKRPPPPVVKPPPPPPPVIRPPTPVEIVRRDLARFTFMGYLRKQERWTIFLSAGSEIFLVQEGDRFGQNNQFHAVEITPEQLVIEQASQGRIVVPLVDKQPLVPSSLPASLTGGRVSESTPLAVEPETESVPVPEVPGGPRPFRSNPFRTVGAPVPAPGLPAAAPAAENPANADEVNNER